MAVVSEVNFINLFAKDCGFRSRSEANVGLIDDWLENIAPQFLTQTNVTIRPKCHVLPPLNGLKLFYRVQSKAVATDDRQESTSSRTEQKA